MKTIYVIFLACVLGACSPDPETAYLRRMHSGDLYAAALDYDEAYRDYNQAAAINVHPNRALQAKGELYALQGDYNNALQAFDQAIYTRNDNYTTYIHRADAYAHMGQYQKAVKEINTCIQLQPKLAMAYRIRASYKYVLGYLQDAIDDATKAIDLQPDYENYHSRVIYYSARHLFPEAKKDIDSMMAHNEFEDPRLYTAMGYCLSQMGDTANACSYFRFGNAGGDPTAADYMLRYCK